MLNFGASKPRVRGGARAPGAPPGSAPEGDLIGGMIDFLFSLFATCRLNRIGLRFFRRWI